MAYRNIEVDGKSYRWTCGREKVIIQNSEGKRVAEVYAGNIGVVNDWTDGHYGPFHDVTVTPKHVANYIRERERYNWK